MNILHQQINVNLALVLICIAEAIGMCIMSVAVLSLVEASRRSVPSEGDDPPFPSPMAPEPHKSKPPVIPITFEDGYAVTPDSLRALGLAMMVDKTGKIVNIVNPTAGWTKTVDEWAGGKHGKRTS
jgi:hypothetical protein